MRTFLIPRNNLYRGHDNMESMITHYVPNLDSEYWCEINPLTEEQILSLGYEKMRGSIGFVSGCYIKRIQVLAGKAPADTVVPRGA